ncbi:hypothetical protein Ancab_016345 [Ancistrocladus abbreviatus]
METQDCNSSDIRPEAEVGSANASNNFSPYLIEDLNDIPSNQDDFDQSTIDPSAHPSKKIGSKVWDHLIKIRAENLKDQKAQCKYCNAILGADPTKGTSCLKNHIDRCKKYPANIELAQRKLALQARFSVDGSKLMIEGKGASAIGLTAAVHKDPVTRASTVGFCCWSYNSCWSSLQACCSVIAAVNPITGIARTSLIVTIGPSPRHRRETASTILFGQREDNMCASKELAKVEKLLENEMSLRRAAEVEAGGNAEIIRLHKLLEDETTKKKKLQEERTTLQSQLLHLTFDADQMQRHLDRLGSGNGFSSAHTLMLQGRHSQIKGVDNGLKSSFNSLFEQVRLQKILSMLESQDANIRIHAVKVVANLAAEGCNTYF